jgi:signal transduction histidine kinase
LLGGEAPSLEEVQEAVRDIVQDGTRAAEVIARIRALLKKAPTQAEPLDINQVIVEVVGLTRGACQRHDVVLQMALATDLPTLLGDRVQLQQVLLNLIMNGIEAMRPITTRPRHLRIASQREGFDRVLVVVRDSGVGLDPQNIDRIFHAFFTTKPQGIGMGLSISRSIVEAHGGRLWATPNVGPGTTLQFTLPAVTGGHR